jgi:hypothetical protein
MSVSTIVYLMLSFCFILIILNTQSSDQTREIFIILTAILCLIKVINSILMFLMSNYLRNINEFIESTLLDNRNSQEYDPNSNSHTDWRISYMTPRAESKQN